MTDIRNTWEPYLKAGEEIEREFLIFLRILFPTAEKIKGNYKFADFKVPEQDDLMLEIKRDYKSHDTGNWAIEIRFRGEKSGLSATKAQVWIMVDEKKYYCFGVQQLKDFLRLNWIYLMKIMGGDNNEAEMILVNKRQLVNQSFCTSFYRDGRNVSLFYSFLEYNGFIKVGVSIDPSVNPIKTNMSDETTKPEGEEVATPTPEGEATPTPEVPTEPTPEAGA